MKGPVEAAEFTRNKRMHKYAARLAGRNYQEWGSTMNPVYITVPPLGVNNYTEVGHGYCRPTDVGGDCSTGRQGAWDRVRSRHACLQRCDSCERCRFVSFSANLPDCSWYASCDVSRLRTEHRSFVTLAAHGRGPIEAEPPWRTVKLEIAGASPGYCAVTEPAARGDCTIGDSGLLGTRARPPRNLRQCTELCHNCARCAFVSWSAKNADCSWYSEWCGSSHLNTATSLRCIGIDRLSPSLAATWTICVDR